LLARVHYGVMLLVCNRHPIDMTAIVMQDADNRHIDNGPATLGDISKMVRQR